jgi:Cu-Zn family superoxide dismutase
MNPQRFRFARNLVIGATISLAALHFSGCDDDANAITGAVLPGQGDTLTAQAQVRGYTDSSIRGTVWFQHRGDSVTVTAAIAGLVPGKAYAIHVHQIGNCRAPDSSGDHFAAGEIHGNPFDTLGAHHRGDLPNLQVGPAGLGQTVFKTRAFNLDSGNANSVLCRSVVVHMNADDYVSQPAGNSGARIACGVIDASSPADTVGMPRDTSGIGGKDTIGVQDTSGNGGYPPGIGILRK